MLKYVKQNNGIIGFPKGHVEQGETEEETTYYMEEYDAYKTVVYFIGIIDDVNIHKQESEISDIYDQTKELLVKVASFLNINL